MDILTQLLDSETGITGPLFWGGIIVVALWEVLLPLRPLTHSVMVRWLSNIGVAVFTYALLRWTIGFLTFDVAIAAEQHGWGLLHMSALSPWAAVVLGLLWLDLVSYVIHQVFHRIPVLWRVSERRDRRVPIHSDDRREAKGDRGNHHKPLIACRIARTTHFPAVRRARCFSHGSFHDAE